MPRPRRHTVCPLCHALLVAVQEGLRCDRCGVYPRVRGVAVLVPQPAPLLRHAWDGVVHAGARLALRRRAAERARSLSREDRAAAARALAAMTTNQALLEDVVPSGLASARRPRGFAELSPSEHAAGPGNTGS